MAQIKEELRTVKADIDTEAAQMLKKAIKSSSTTSA